MSNEVKIPHSRKKIYNYPNTITCTITGRVVKLNPNLLHKKLIKEGRTFEEYAKSFVARKTRLDIGEGRIKVADGKVEDVIENPPKRPDFADQKAKRKDVIKAIWLKVCEQSPEYYREKYGIGEIV